MKHFWIVALVFAVLDSAGHEARYITTSDSVKIYVHEGGTGFPVLFVHGGPGSNSGYFEHMGGSIFERDAHMIYMDQRGAGRSGNAVGKDYSLNRVVKDMEEVRQALGIEQWILMPHSFGGIIATEYSRQYPSRVKAMVFLNATISIDHSAKSGLSTALAMLRQAGFEYPELSDDNVPLLQRWGSSFGKLQEHGLFYKVMFDTQENFRLHDSVSSSYSKQFEFSQHVWNYPEYFKDFSHETEKLKMPVLVITGSRDFTIGLDHYALMKFPIMEVITVQGGHALYMEHQQELYDAVRPFLHQCTQ